MLHRFAALILCLAAASIAGCGDKEAFHTRGENEGIYVTTGGLTYQVQISRILNPTDDEDKSFLVGLPEGVRPGNGETWFAVFLRVENNGKRPLRTADDFEIRDTLDNEFRPVSIDAVKNPFAYVPGTLTPGSLVPRPDTAGFNSPPLGAMLLFRVKFASLQNRPLEFVIKPSQQPGVQTAVVNLDV